MRVAKLDRAFREIRQLGGDPAQQRRKLGFRAPHQFGFVTPSWSSSVASGRDRRGLLADWTCAFGAGRTACGRNVVEERSGTGACGHEAAEGAKDGKRRTRGRGTVGVGKTGG